MVLIVQNNILKNDLCMGLSSKASKLIAAGFTNHNTEDIGVLASSKQRITYDWYCSSRACCMIDKQFYSRKAKKTYKVTHVRVKVLKVANTFETQSKCPDCGQLLFSLTHK